MRLLLLLALLAPAIAFAQPRVALSVESQKKTTKTTGGNSSIFRNTDFVDRVTLNIALNAATGSAVVEVSACFVGKNIKTEQLDYFGFETQSVAVSQTKNITQIVSQPFPYSEHKPRNSTAETRSGSRPWGWVVFVKSGAVQLAVKASSPEVLAWVDKNPPKKIPKISR